MYIIKNLKMPEKLKDRTVQYSLLSNIKGLLFKFTNPKHNKAKVLS